MCGFICILPSTEVQVNAKQRAKEVSSAEQVALLAEQMLRKLGCETTALTVTSKAWTTLAAQLDARLTPSMATALHELVQSHACSA